LLTLALQPYVRTVTGADLSLNMVEVLEGKIRERGLKNVRTVHLGPEGAIALAGRFHLIVSAMTFHHIHDIPVVLRQFHEILLPGGRICVADLEAEGGRFHTSNEGVYHFGFDPSELAGLFQEAGFDSVAWSTAATVENINAEGMPHIFPVFLMKARKPS
jgi:SAM-dependent methyltransferase